MARKKLGEMLVESGLLDPDGLRSALSEQRRWGHALGRTLVEMRLITEEALVDVLAKQLLVPKVDLGKVQISPAVLALVPAELAERYHLIPFAQPSKFLDVAMADPTNAGIIDELRIRTQLNIRPHLAGPRTIEQAIGRYYLGAADLGIPLGGPGTWGSSLPPDPPAVRFAPPVPKPAPARSTPAGPPPVTRDLEIDVLQARLSQLEALVERDEQVLRKLFALLIDKGIATREDILERLGE
jgi:hypothetical protein